MATTFLLALFVIGSFDPSHEIDCNHIVPGITRMSRGVDITTLDLLPTKLLVANGFRHSLFEFTCNKNHSWTHPTIAQYSYNLPDQIAAINTIPAGALNIRTSFFQDLHHYKDSLAVNVGIDASFGLWGSFSASVGYKEAREQIMRSNKSIAETSASVSAVQIDFESNNKMLLNDNLLSFIKELPARYEDDPEAYSTFIDAFGTHYFESGSFGGYLYQKTIIKNSYLYKTDEKNISANVNAKFAQMVFAKVSVDKQKSSVDEEFNSNSETHFYYYGGMTDLPNQEELSKWWDTVSKDPWLFGGQLAPIENLIHNRTIKSQMKKAISVHKAKAYFLDLKSTIYLGKISLSERNLNKLAAMEHNLNNPKSSQDELNNVAKNIDDLFVLVQEIRDRALLKEYYDKMVTSWDKTLKCKVSIALGCKTSPMIEEIQKQRNLFEYLKIDKIWKLLYQSAPPDRKEVVELIQEATKLMHYHETTVVDLCQGNAECQKCLEDNADCWYSEEQNSSYANCKTPTEWRIIQYHAKKVAPCSYKKN